MEKQFTVVTNAEGQFSLWLADRPPPKGWTPTGPSASRVECLAYLENVWKVLTPKSLRPTAKGK